MIRRHGGQRLVGRPRQVSVAIALAVQGIGAVLGIDNEVEAELPLRRRAGNDDDSGTVVAGKDLPRNFAEVPLDRPTVALQRRWIRRDLRA